MERKYLPWLHVPEEHTEYIFKCWAAFCFKIRFLTTGKYNLIHLIVHYNVSIVSIIKTSGIFWQEHETLDIKKHLIAEGKELKGITQVEVEGEVGEEMNLKSRQNRLLHLGHLWVLKVGCLPRGWPVSGTKVFKQKRDFKGQVIGKHLSETSLFKVQVVSHYGLSNQLSKCARIFKRWHHIGKLECISWSSTAP